MIMSQEVDNNSVNKVWTQIQYSKCSLEVGVEWAKSPSSEVLVEDKM